jgi:hypothetical protein
METTSVDKDFEETLNSELKTDGVRVENKDKEEEDEEESSEDENPITEHTKNLIACKFANSLRTDPAVMSKMITCLKHIDKMSEGEARKYLAVLNNSNIGEMSNSTVDYVLKHLSNHFINPERPDIKEDFLKDRFVRMMLNDKLTSLFLYLGDMAGAILFIMYSLDSWYGNKNVNVKEESNASGS